MSFNFGTVTPNNTTPTTLQQQPTPAFSQFGNNLTPNGAATAPTQFNSFFPQQTFSPTPNLQLPFPNVFQQPAQSVFLTNAIQQPISQPSVFQANSFAQQQPQQSFSSFRNSFQQPQQQGQPLQSFLQQPIQTPLFGQVSSPVTNFQISQQDFQNFLNHFQIKLEQIDQRVSQLCPLFQQSQQQTVPTMPTCLSNGLPMQVPIYVPPLLPPSQLTSHASNLAFEYFRPTPPLNFVPRTNLLDCQLKPRSDFDLLHENRGEPLWRRQLLSSSSPSDECPLLPTKKHGSTCLYHPHDQYNMPPCYFHPMLIPSEYRHPYYWLDEHRNSEKKDKLCKWRNGYQAYLCGDYANPVRRKTADKFNERLGTGIYSKEEEERRTWRRLEDSAIPKRNFYSTRRPTTPYNDPNHFSILNSNLPNKRWLIGKGPPLKSHMDDEDRFLYNTIQRFSDKSTAETVAKLPKQVVTTTSTPTKEESRPMSIRGILEKPDNEVYARTSTVFRSSKHNFKVDTEDTASQTLSSSFVSSVTCPTFDEIITACTNADKRLRGGRRIGQVLDRLDPEENTLKHQEVKITCRGPSGYPISNDPLLKRISRLDDITGEDEVEGGYYFRSGVHLKRQGYYCIPDRTSLDQSVNLETGECWVKDFEVGHETHGKVVFNGWTNVAGLDLDKIIGFDHKIILLYEYVPKPKFGEGLHKPCTVTLANVWPKEHSDLSGNTVIKDVRRIDDIGFEGTLRVICTHQFKGKFVSYNPYIGEWVFRVQLSPPSFDSQFPVLERNHYK